MSPAGGAGGGTERLSGMGFLEGCAGGLGRSQRQRGQLMFNRLPSSWALTRAAAMPSKGGHQGIDLLAAGRHQQGVGPIEQVEHPIITHVIEDKVAFGAAEHHPRNH